MDTAAVRGRRAGPGQRRARGRRAARSRAHPTARSPPARTSWAWASMSRTPRSVKVSAYSGGAYLENLVGAGTVIATAGCQLLGPPGSPAVADNTDPRFDDDCAGLGLRSPGRRARRRAPDQQRHAQLGRLPPRRLAGPPGADAEPGAPLRGSGCATRASCRGGELRSRGTGSARTRWCSRHRAPRAGVVYDWTREGRGEALRPLGPVLRVDPDGHQRSLVQRRDDLRAGALNAAAACGGTDPAFGGTDGERCLGPGAISADDRLIGSSGVLVAPGIRAQYLDEAAGGVEYQLPDGLALGAALVHRRLGRVIEDISTDGARSYVIAEPGRVERRRGGPLRGQIDRIDDAAQRQRLEERLAMFRGIRAFERPHREHAALQLTLRRRFGRALDVRASYTYARTRGNYPGLYSPDNGQADPNVSSQYDLLEPWPTATGRCRTTARTRSSSTATTCRASGGGASWTIGARARAVGRAGQRARGLLPLRRGRVVPPAARPAGPHGARSQPRSAHRLPAGGDPPDRARGVARRDQRLRPPGRGVSVDDLRAAGQAGRAGNGVGQRAEREPGLRRRTRI